MESKDYVPQYDNTVAEYNKQAPAISWPINERYCLDPSSAKMLASLFTPPPKAYLAPPIQQAPGSPFAFNHDVPWFEFANGQQRNAGQLATYWGMPGVPADQALSYAIVDVDTPVGV